MSAESAFNPMGVKKKSEPMLGATAFFELDYVKNQETFSYLEKINFQIILTKKYKNLSTNYFNYFLNEETFKEVIQPKIKNNCKFDFNKYIL